MPGPDSDKYPRQFDRIRLLNTLAVKRTREFVASAAPGRVLLVENGRSVNEAVEHIARAVEPLYAASGGPVNA